MLEFNEEQQYALKHLPLHLMDAGKSSELKKLMQDEDFLSLALRYVGIDWSQDLEIKNYLSAL